jgi:hypothetical protein
MYKNTVARLGTQVDRVDREVGVGGGQLSPHLQVDILGLRQLLAHDVFQSVHLRACRVLHACTGVPMDDASALTNGERSPTVTTRNGRTKAARVCLPSKSVITTSLVGCAPTSSLSMSTRSSPKRQRKACTSSFVRSRDWASCYLATCKRSKWTTSLSVSPCATKTNHAISSIADDNTTAPQTT